MESENSGRLINVIGAPVAGIILGPGVTAVNKTDCVPALIDLSSFGGR